MKPLIIAFQRINSMTPEESESTFKPYRFYQSFHDCLYCYETLGDVKYPDSPIYQRDENFKLVKIPDAQAEPITVTSIEEITLEEYEEMENYPPGASYDDMTADEFKEFIEFEENAKAEERRKELLD